MKQIGSTGVQVSNMIFGCWQMGGDFWGPMDEAHAQDLARYAISRGVTTFDTAYCYGKGRAETILGDTLRGVARESYQMITKLWIDSLAYDKAIEACEASLRRLRTDYLDIYFIHYPDSTGTMPIARTMEALNLLRSQGKIRAVGVSNFSLKQLKEARQYGQIDVNQPCYNLLWRFIDAKILPYCQENNISVLPYSSLAQGLLGGRFDLEHRPDADGRQITALCRSPYYEGAMTVVDEVRRIAAKYGTSPACIALNWIMNKPGITAPIIGIKSESQLDGLLDAGSIKLTQQDADSLELISREYAASLPHFATLFNPTIVEDPDKFE